MGPKYRLYPSLTSQDLPAVGENDLGQCGTLGGSPLVGTQSSGAAHPATSLVCMEPRRPGPPTQNQRPSWPPDTQVLRF